VVTILSLIIIIGLKLQFPLLDKYIIILRIKIAIFISREINEFCIGTKIVVILALFGFFGKVYFSFEKKM
jgi:hypothetical protein